MAQVKGKFKCQSVTEFSFGDKEATLVAVYNDGTENADYAKATPSATLKIMISKETKAVDYFKPGKQYSLVFDETE